MKDITDYIADVFSAHKPKLLKKIIDIEGRPYLFNYGDYMFVRQDKRWEIILHIQDGKELSIGMVESLVDAMDIADKADRIWDRSQA